MKTATPRHLHPGVEDSTNASQIEIDEPIFTAIAGSPEGALEVVRSYRGLWPAVPKDCRRHQFDAPPRSAPKDISTQDESQAA